MNKLNSLHHTDKATNRKKMLAFQEKYFHIPKDFSALLINFTVAKPIKNDYSKGTIHILINYFFGFSENRNEDFEYNVQLYETRMPNDLFPIANVDGGDLLCMHKQTGELYYWFHEEDDWGINGVDKMPEKIAHSLDELLGEMRLAVQPTTAEIERAKKEGKIKKLTPFALKLINETRLKKGLPALTMKEWEDTLNGVNN